MSKMLIPFLFLITITTACSDKATNDTSEGKAMAEAVNTNQVAEQQFVIEGNISNAAGRQIFVQEVIMQGAQQQPALFDTAVVQSDGSFRLEGTIPEKQLAVLGFDNQHYVYLILGGGQMTFKSDYTNFMNFNFSAPDQQLAAENQTLQQLLGRVTQNMQQIQQLTQQAQMAQMAQQPPTQLAKVHEQLYTAYDSHYDFLRNFADTTTSLHAAIFATDLLDLSVDNGYVESFRDKLKQQMPNSQYTAHFTTKTNNYASELGQPAPEIHLPMPDGDSLKLSSLKGKVVLIDFWASWCKPCRIENPNVVRIYNKYKDKGFEIFSVSLDTDKQKWISAIQADNLKWNSHVSELKGWRAESSKPYNVNAIPVTFLLNEEGEIIAKNLRGYTLEKKIEQLLD